MAGRLLADGRCLLAGCWPLGDDLWPQAADSWSMAYYHWALTCVRRPLASRCWTLGAGGLSVGSTP
jgi:hypothetical protein